MRVVICDSAEAAISRVADHISGHIQSMPKTVLGLATGGTMERLYAVLREMHKTGLSFAGIKAFNLDEYVGISGEHPQSYAHYMKQHLFDHIDINQDYCFIPSGTEHPFEASRDYENLLSEHGPIQLQLLGLGHNGHIGFNEPGSSLASRTREKALSQTTLEKNKRYFSKDEKMPLSAITMGIQSIIDSKEILLMALGAEKAQAVKSMVEGPLSAFCPASVLQMHPKVTVVLDTAAANELTLKDHYTFAERLQKRREAAVSASTS